MKKFIIITYWFFVICAFSSGQDQTTLLDAYQRNFVSASLNTKLELLKEASTHENANMSPLFETALRFVLSTYSVLPNDIKLKEITLFCIKNLQKSESKTSAELIYTIFITYKDNTIRVPAANALGDLATDNTIIIDNLNSFLANQVSLFKSGIVADYPTILEITVALGKLGNGTSFSSLFSVYIAGLNESITNKALESIKLLKGDFNAFIINIIEKNPAQEKLAALKIALQYPSLKDEEKGAIAEASLNYCIKASSSNISDIAIIKEIRVTAVKALTTLSWSKASKAAIANFNYARNEYQKSQSAKSILLESIAFLGAVGTSDAAEALTLYLEYVNTQTEKNAVFDEQITLAVINNLGLLADKVAFNHLLYIASLNYPDSIKKAAREALSKIKW